MAAPAVPVRSSLEVLLASFPSLLVAFSGGVDSAVLAVQARRLLGRRRTLAVMGVSGSLPADQRSQARDIASAFDLDFLEVATGELADPGYTANAPDRCYFCKRELWNQLGVVARERGLAAVADGTNADDLGEHRPGLRAAAEAHIRSPLAEAGLTKEQVRAMARSLGLPIWNAPAAPCLSSRVLYGLSVTPERLRQVEQGESILRAAGVRGDLRLRHRGAEARIEVAPAEFASVRARAAEIGPAILTLGFSVVTLDLRGYRRGSLLASAEPRLEVLASQA
ncbi:MAG TPA: ATP-dependent sacrificial sulfur transferase LarE [Gemmatimonadales bacterium]|nr:ATP-dependent sacrificial sulfur transferase LarE [Gemmatimonadales bacterium]